MACENKYRTYVLINYSMAGTAMPHQMAMPHQIAYWVTPYYPLTSGAYLDLDQWKLYEIDRAYNIWW